MLAFIKLIVWLQLPPKLIASDYITTGTPLGAPKAGHSGATPPGAWGGGSETWGLIHGAGLPQARSIP